MSTEIRGGGLIVKDPQSKRVVSFTWDDDLADDAEISTSTFVISGPDSELTQDNAGLETGNRSAKVRLIGGTLGSRYTLTHRIVTNESPAQEDDESVTVLIQHT